MAAKDLGEAFRHVEGVVTLASSTAGEKSQIWDEKQQSLFSYWLNEGLKGHADTNGDAAVDIDEIYRYVYRNVTYTAKTRFPRAQTPVRIVRTGTPAVPAILQLRPLTLSELLSDIAETLAERIDERNCAKVGVLEFVNDTAVGEMLGANYGALGKWCTDQLEQQLTDFAMGRFRHRRPTPPGKNAEGYRVPDCRSGIGNTVADGIPQRRRYAGRRGGNIE